MYRKLICSARKDCSGVGNPLGDVDVGEVAFTLFTCAVIVEKSAQWGPILRASDSHLEFPLF